MATAERRVELGPLLIVWTLTAGAYAAKALLLPGTPLIRDTDDAMRLTEVHDFLAGQNWFDLVQHRLNTPYGGELHWSRLVDLPEAVLLWLLRIPFGAMADTVAAYAWPLLLLLPLLWLTGKLALRLGPHESLPAALFLPGLAVATFVEFAPGRFDHHSMQILLTLAMVLCTLISLDRPRFAVGAGVAGAAALAIGIEGLPMVGATAAVFALMWVASPRNAAALRNFGLSFALAMALGLAQGVHPARWLELRLDAISIVYVAAAALTAIAFLLLSTIGLRSIAARLAAAILAGAVVCGLLLWLDPQILKGPYAALDPWLVRNWLSHINEAQTWWSSLLDNPVSTLATTIPVLVGVAASLWLAARAPSGRGAWLIMLALLAIGCVVMLIQIRAARIVTPLAVPAAAALIGLAWRRFVAHRRLLPALGVAGAWFGSAGLAIAVTLVLLPLPPSANADASSSDACIRPAAFAPLAALPPTRIIAPIDLGSHLLLFTPHSVVAAPYHRNQQGLLDNFRFFLGPIGEGRRILAERGIGLVVACPSMSEFGDLVPPAPDSFVALFRAGSLPGWLVDRTPAGSPLRVYAVTAP